MFGDRAAMLGYISGNGRSQSGFVEARQVRVTRREPVPRLPIVGALSNTCPATNCLRWLRDVWSRSKTAMPRSGLSLSNASIGRACCNQCGTRAASKLSSASPGARTTWIAFNDGTLRNDILDECDVYDRIVKPDDRIRGVQPAKLGEGAFEEERPNRQPLRDRCFGSCARIPFRHSIELRGNGIWRLDTQCASQDRRLQYLLWGRA